MSATRVLLFSLFVATAIAIAFIASNRSFMPQVTTQSPPPHCEPFTDKARITGPAMTARQVEEKELEEARRFGTQKSASFGRLNKEWGEFKSKLRPGDAFYEYSDSFSGGYAIVRGNCVLDTFMTWIS